MQSGFRSRIVRRFQRQFRQIDQTICLNCYKRKLISVSFILVKVDNWNRLGYNVSMLCKIGWRVCFGNSKECGEDRKMFQKLEKLIFRDVKNENETKKVSVILRLNAIVMCIYFLCLLCTFFVSGEVQLLIWCVPCFSAFVAAFYTTYLNKTGMAVVVSHVIMVCWVIGFIWEFGWDCGAQHFIFVLVVLCFTVCYERAVWKVTMGIAACILRLLLFAYTNLYPPHCVLDPGTGVLFQIINTVFTFTAIAVILMVFAKDSQEMEQKLIQYNEKLHFQASIDPLTGLLNRRSMREYLEKSCDDYGKRKIENLSVAIGDIDFFKRVNDTYGHECGDIVLKNLAAIFKEEIQKCGKVSRWGGEEFLFVFNNLNGDEALVFLEELREKLKRMTIPYKDEMIKVTMTFGLSEFDFQRGIDYSVSEADGKLYKGKETGRDRIVY